jgi:hypothetical protein
LELEKTHEKESEEDVSEPFDIPNVKRNKERTVK